MEKTNSETRVAKKERECLFTNTNQSRKSLMEEIARISDMMMQKLGMTLQEEGKQAHSRMEFIGKLLNEKLGQKLKGLEQTVIEKIETQVKTTILEEKIDGLTRVVKNMENDL
jgi:hypothetical protein